MPSGLSDVVRPYQLPENAAGERYALQYNLASNAPIYVTPGFGALYGAGPTPPVHSGSGHFSMTVTYYCVASTFEADLHKVLV